MPPPCHPVMKILISENNYTNKESTKIELNTFRCSMGQIIIQENTLKRC